MSVGYALRRMFQGSLAYALWGLGIGIVLGCILGAAIPEKMVDIIEQHVTFLQFAVDLGNNTAESVTEGIGKAMGDILMGGAVGVVIGPILGALYGIFHGFYYSDM